MALTGSTIASTYLKLLRINTDTMGADATASYIQDSADTDSVLSISTTRVGIGNAAPASVLHLTGTMQVGADGSGHDVIFYSGTAGDNFTWDASEEKLTITGTDGQTALDIADGNLVVADSVDIEGDIDVNGTANLDVVDIDGAVDMASTLTLAGNADFNGDLDVDGTANLDAVDIDGNIDMAACFTWSGGGSYMKCSSSGYRFNNDTDSINILVADNNGWVYIPQQPAFLAYPSANQVSMAVGTRVPIAFGTEVFDQGSNFATDGDNDNAGTFTAPVAGRYQLNAVIRVNDLDIDAPYHEVRIVTSNRTYVEFFSPRDTDMFYFSFGFSTLADMDASDTAYIDYYNDGGATQSDMIASSTRFSGYLAC